MDLQTMYPAANSVIVQTSAEVPASADEIAVTDASVFPTAPNFATIGTDNNAEVILYQGVDIGNNKLTGCLRGRSYTVARNWGVGSYIYHSWTASNANAIMGNVRSIGAGVTDGSALPSNLVKTDANGTIKNLFITPNAAGAFSNGIGLGSSDINDGFSLVTDDTHATGYLRVRSSAQEKYCQIGIGTDGTTAIGTKSGTGTWVNKQIWNGFNFPVEKGTWVPKADNITSIYTASYARQGKVVHFEGNIGIKAISSASQFAITGLPFNCAVGAYSNIYFSYYAGITGVLAGVITAGASGIGITKNGQWITYNDVAVNTQLMFQGVLFID